MKKTLKKITLLFFACLFLMINSIGSNVAFGSYTNTKFQKPIRQSIQEEAILPGMVAGVAAVALTVSAVYETGTTLGKAAYHFFGEELAQSVVPVENPNDFSKFDI